MIERQLHVLYETVNMMGLMIAAWIKPNTTRPVYADRKIVSIRACFQFILGSHYFSENFQVKECKMRNIYSGSFYMLFQGIRLGFELGLRFCPGWG